jgi:aerobic carbon-monoxide dehydrogenase medium subunit
MKAFDYLRPSSIEEACSYLAAGDGAAKILAGGTDLLVQMKNGKLKPMTLVSLRDVPGLSFCRRRDDGALMIGAATPLAELEDSDEVKEGFPALAEAAASIGSVQVRTRATVGGNLCNAAPSADLAPILIALGASATIAAGRSERTVLLDDFFTGPGATVLRPMELLTSITVPQAPPGSFATYLKSYRSAMDIAVVGVGLFVDFATQASGESAGTVRNVRLTLGAVAPTPMRARETEQMLRGHPLDEESIEEAARKAAAEARPITDLRAPAEYRRELVEVLSRRALRAAASWTAQGGRG